MKHFTPQEYLKIDIAGNYDSALDKENFEDRIIWFDNNKDKLVDLLESAEEPALYYAGLKAYSAAEEGKPSGYPISLDACSSGLQFLSILIGCEKSAKLCGVVSTGKREDSYTILYSKMCEMIGDAAKIDRKDNKRAIMTALYGSTAVPKEVFGTGELLDIFYKTMETEASGAWALNKSLQDLWQLYALSHDWVLPDNFHVKCKVMSPEGNTVHFMNQPIEIFIKSNIGKKHGLSLSPNIIHSIDGMVVREMQARAKFSPKTLVGIINSINSKATSNSREKDEMLDILWSHYKQSGFLSARILNYIDVENMGNVDSLVIAKLIQTFPDKPYDLISIHDCFRVLPNYGNDVRQQYNNILADIASSDLLSYIASQVVGKKLTVKKRGNIADKVRVADYALS